MIAKNLTAEEKKLILKKRAEKLAVSLAEKSGGEVLDVIVFRLGEERYAIESRYILEVYPLKELTPLPNLPPFVCGITNIRRRIVSVIDLKIFFDISKKEKNRLDKIIILANAFMEFAVLTDEVEGVSQIPKASIQTSLLTLTEMRQEFLKGLTTDQLIILDGEKLLNDKKLIVQ
jgi:purine-binding chemotaxis protein CheW